MAHPVTDTSLADRLQQEVARAIQRNLKGLEYLGSPDPDVGTTPKTVLHRRGTLSLYHDHPMTSDVYRVPVMLVMAPTNKAYIFDLAPGQSLIEFLLKRGYDMYVMDWNAPTLDEKHLTLEDYALDFIPDCLRRIQQDSGVDEVTIMGYCAGGVLACGAVATALLAQKMSPEVIAVLVFIVGFTMSGGHGLI